MKTKLAIIGLATVSILALNTAPAATFTVTNTADSGSGSLRQAILDANAATGDDLITFTVTGTITLASALPAITDNTTITGPGTNLLTISGNNAVQVFRVNAGTTNTISCLTIANGLAAGYANGAGIANAGSSTLINCALLNNTNLYGWGGAVFNSGSLAVTNCLFLMNDATGENGANKHGSSSLDGVNAAGGAAGLGGAIFSSSGDIVISGSRFHGNTVLAGNGGDTSGLIPYTGRGGGIYGGGNGGSDTGSGGTGGFGSGGGAGGWYSGNGGAGGFGGGGGASGGTPANAGIGGFGAGTGSDKGGGGAGGGAGLGAAIYMDSGSLVLVDSIITGSQEVGGMGGPRARNGYGFLASVFFRTGTVQLVSSGASIATTNTLFQTWTNGNLIYRAPFGTPKVFLDSQFLIGDFVTRKPVQVSLQNGFAGGTMVYSLNGSDPRVSLAVYGAPFIVKTSSILRVVSYSSDFLTTVEMEPVQITVLPTLTVTTAGGGSVSVVPTNGPYFQNSTAQITAQPASGCAFLQWLGDASGTNPVTTVTMSRNKFVQAVFGTALATNVIGGGSLLIDPALPLYPFGTTVKVTAQPQTGNYFAQWGASASGTNNPVSFVVSNANPNVAAIFLTLSANKYALTVIESGQGHVLENPRANAHSNGQSVSLTAQPDAGQNFISWSGDANGTQNPLLVTVSSNKVITANFSKRPSLRVGTPLEGLVTDGFRLSLTGEFGAPYTILASTNFVDWMVAGTVTNTYGTVQLTDSVATNLPYRFYRALTN